MNKATVISVSYNFRAVRDKDMIERKLGSVQKAAPPGPPGRPDL